MIRFLLILSLMATLAFVACTPKEEAPATDETADAMEKQAPQRKYMDADGDGQVTLEEQKQHASDMFMRFDADGDGVYTSEEMAARQDEAFKRWDDNGDAMITVEEFKLYTVGEGWEEVDTEGVECMEAPCFKHAHMDADGDGVVGPAERLVYLERRFEVFDANSDGSVDIDEFKTTTKEMYEAMDTNSDGVTAEELVMFRCE